MSVEKQVHYFGRSRIPIFVYPGRVSLFILLVLSRVPQAQQQYQDQIPSQYGGRSSSQLSLPLQSAIPQTAAEQAKLNDFQVFNPSGPGRGLMDQPFQWGKVIFRPHLTYRYSYGNGVQSAPGEQRKTVVQEISPGVLIEFGPNWVLDYTPTLRYYSDSHFKDGVDQSVTLRGGTTYNNWQFGMLQSYSSSSAPTVETGGQVDQSTYLTALNASCEINDRLTADLGANQNINIAQSLQNSREWSTLDWLNFKMWSRLNFGVGVGGGYVNVDTGSDQIYEQAQARIRWRLTDRLSASANAGLEDRQFRTGGRGDLINPLYGAALQYQPFDYTDISATLDHSVSQSFFADEITENTIYGLTLNQRLLGKLNLNLTGSYSDHNYISSSLSAMNRMDTLYSFTARLSCPLIKRGTVGISYEYTHNSSTQTGLSYDSTQIGFDIGYRY